MGDPSSLFPNLLLQFDQHDAETDWQRNFVDGCEVHDLRHTSMSLVFCLSVASRYWYSTDRVYIYILLESIGAAVLIYLQTSKRDFYATHRSTIIAMTRITRICSAMLLVASPEGELASPIITTKEFIWTRKAILLLLPKGFGLSIQAFGYRVPFAQHVWLQLGSLAVVLASVDQRCILQCGTNESFYFLFFSSVGKFLGMLQHNCPWFVGPNFLMERGTCRQICNATNLTITTVIGYIFPTLVLMAFEESSRMNFICRRFGKTPIFPTAKTMVIYSLILLIFYTSLVFVFINTVLLVISPLSSFLKMDLSR